MLGFWLSGESLLFEKETVAEGKGLRCPGTVRSFGGDSGRAGCRSDWNGSVRGVRSVRGVLARPSGDPGRAGVRFFNVPSQTSIAGLSRIAEQETTENGGFLAEEKFASPDKRRVRSVKTLRTLRTKRPATRKRP
jgi:hypothetical protein